MGQLCFEVFVVMAAAAFLALIIGTKKLTDPPVRKLRLLVCLALGLYMASLCLPAMQERGESLFGIQACVLAFMGIFYFSFERGHLDVLLACWLGALANLSMLLSLLLMIVGHRRALGGARLLSGASFMFTLIAIVPPVRGGYGLSSGYLLWVAAAATLAIASLSLKMECE